jgi:long-chain acyl-CoA synthetase
MRHQSLIEHLGTFTKWGRETAYLQQQGYRMASWSYRDVVNAALRFAAELESRKIQPGERVLLWGQNSAEWVAAFYGCVLRGTVAVPMDQIATPDFARRVARQVNARLLVAGREHAQLDPSLPTLILDNLGETIGHHAADARRLSAPASGIGRDSIVEIVFTSGTTAEPKGVVITHGNILANLEPIETEIAKYRNRERWFHPLRFLNLLPLSHVFGQFLGLFIPPLMGATVIFQDTLNPSEIVRTIRARRVSVLVAVPRVLDSLKAKIERDLEAEGKLERFHKEMLAAEGQKFLRRMWRFRRIHWKFGWKFWAFISGGAALAEQTETFWNRLGFAVVQGYGMTETTSLITVNHPFKLGKGSIGKVLPGLEVKLDENGEIMVRGENVAAGYWEGSELKPAAGAGDAEAGWLHTGDLGERDAEGNLYFKGRKKNVIVTPAGMNVYPEDLEAALRRQPEVHDCAVLGIERDGNAEPCAVLLVRDRAADPAGIVERANQSLAEYQRMRRWFVWPEEDFPRTGTLKPRVNVIREAVERGTAGAGEPTRLEGKETGGLEELIARVKGRTPGSVTAGAKLETDLQLSSLDRVELMSAIEDRYQVDLNETQFAAAATVEDLERLLHHTSTRRSDYRYPRWTQRWPVRWIRLAVYYALTWPATHLMVHPRVIGRERLRGVRGPVLVVPNHQAYLDVGFVLAVLPLRFRHRLAVAMGGERLQAMRNPPPARNFLVRWFQRLRYALVVSLFNVFPLPMYSGFRESFRFAGESIDRGYSILVFPEGDVTPDGTIQRFRSGIGLLSNHLGIPILPMRIEGLYELRIKRQRFARPGLVRVTIGEPVEFPPDADPEKIAQELQQIVQGL